MVSCDETKQKELLTDEEIQALEKQGRQLYNEHGNCLHVVTELAWLEDGTTSNCFDYCRVCGDYVQ